MRLVSDYFRQYTLRTQTVVAFLAVALTALMLLALFYIRTTRTALIEQGNQALYAAASRTAISLDAFFSANLDAIRAEATLPSMVSYISLPTDQRTGSNEEAIVKETLAVLRNKDLTYIASYAILDNQGHNLTDNVALDIGLDESDRDYFQQPFHTGLPYVSSVEFASRIGGVYFYFSSPIRNRVGQIAGVLRVRYSVALLQKLVSDSRGLAGERSYAILLDENTLRLSQDAAPELIFRAVASMDPVLLQELRAQNHLPNLPISQISSNLSDFAAGLRHVDEQPFFAAEEFVNGGQIEQMAVVSLETQPWYIVYAQPQEIFLAPIERATQVTVAWTGIVAILLLIAAAVIARLLTNPISHLTIVADRITAGDLTAQAQIESGDEIGRLALAFNNMTTQLRRTLEGLERREEALQNSNNQLEAALAVLKETQAQMVQQERVAAVGQLAAGIAHDFNNIMATVILYTDLLLKASDLSEKDRKRIELIHKQGQRAADLTQQILDFSRKSVMKRQDLDLRIFLDDLQTLLVRTLPENIHFSFVTTLERGIVHADPTRLQQVILNLVINARNAMPDGGDLKITLTSHNNSIPYEVTSSTLEPGWWLVVKVADNGTGIPPDALAHIFEPFFTTRAPLGSGLGLSQVYGIIKQHSGHIDVSTQLGTGTTFTIYLPALATTALDMMAEPNHQLTRGLGEVVLVAEDDENIREALTHSLELLNYRVLTAADGDEALILYRREKDDIALVLSDLVMPNMGGKELLQILKRENSTLRAIIITGYPLTDQEAELKALGTVGWCQKPVNIEQLSQVMAHALRPFTNHHA